MHRSAPRLTRILACAAVPVMLVATGCSSDDAPEASASPSAPAAGGASAAPASSAPPAPSVTPAKYAKLPDACKAVTAKTVEDLVPEVKKKAGTPGKSSDLNARGNCSWNGLEDNGVKGSDYRWLDVSFLRFDSDQTLGGGEKRAQDKYVAKVAEVKATEGAIDLRTSSAPGVGNEARAISYSLKKTGETFRYGVIVARAENVVVTVSYNGTGYAGAKAPAAGELMEGTVKAVKDAIAAVTAANK
ncbi:MULTISPECIES: hypothetical protein [Streptomyces]|uniref:DUF3558 domain-containing protein n=2 Tax=Streptomyces TaxID=1883 RepID=A0A1D8G4E1_9ACTN|nr:MULTISPECIES: hypothetical protein [Streptomyces]AOT60332.1 hypothetical protein A4G23_03203 [Streptomyces rubrolavendulae]KAF0650761.1 hypothetical protein K701_07125 [Streptomyces fradiae ATCC 10745 = DSM 40063]OSY53805.1 hypothetical protein BG846_00524 [Streptomyces fradiae ATCC 10745 = DSM 40063]QEV13464.1 DUF3558 domain-containing protein [Streptomyces fradiae ATCC 10745 = DSM 40063]UQS31292.1 DUF3558 domain-containing protein [Streptomyces fradiae]